ncbi:hypothetical protein Goklo_017829 [Gossypium klotzschianum]|uniref:RNase H type-1 domain-containing protein n=1 Tax=Gossypium klotzschianum TaxID=34286 RepID=A0A7J8UIW5_9ROSI|nr:hypothetical protein [Gossypium klotzschianum]
MDSVIEANPIDTQVNPLNNKNNPSDIGTNLPHNIRNPLSAENFTISIFTTTSKCAGSVGKPGSWLEHAAAAGGRDHTGNLVSWVCAPYGGCLVLEAEIWGAYDGLWQAWELRPRKIILETDSMAAVQLLRGQLADKSSIAIVREVRRLLKMQWEVRIQHT